MPGQFSKPFQEQRMPIITALTPHTENKR